MSDDLRLRAEMLAALSDGFDNGSLARRIEVQLRAVAEESRKAAIEECARRIEGAFYDVYYGRSYVDQDNAVEWLRSMSATPARDGGK